MKIKIGKKYDYLEHPLYERKDDKIRYDHACRCKKKDRLTDLYFNLCFRCMRLIKLKKTQYGRNCKHIGDGSSLNVCEKCGNEFVEFNKCMAIIDDIGF